MRDVRGGKPPGCWHTGLLMTLISVEYGDFAACELAIPPQRRLKLSSSPK